MKGWRMVSIAALLGIFLPSCSSSPKSEDYPGYMTRPYRIRGKKYVPMSVERALYFSQTGIASHYDESGFWGFSSGETSIGEDVRPWHLHAAHPYLPLPCEVRVTSLRTGKSVKVRVNDRGPFVKGRVIDLSSAAAKKLGFRHAGLEKVHIQVLSVGDGKWKRKSPVFH